MSLREVLFVFKKAVISFSFFGNNLSRYAKKSMLNFSIDKLNIFFQIKEEIYQLVIFLAIFYKTLIFNSYYVRCINNVYF